MEHIDLLPTGVSIIITFKTGLCLSGIVEGWTDNGVLILCSNNSENKVLVYNFDETVMFVKVIFDDVADEEIREQPRTAAVKIMEPKVVVEPEDTIEDIVEKKKESISSLRNKVAAHLHRGPGEVNTDYGIAYGYPDFSRKS